MINILNKYMLKVNREILNHYYELMKKAIYIYPNNKEAVTLQNKLYRINNNINVTIIESDYKNSEMKDTIVSNNNITILLTDEINWCYPYWYFEFLGVPSKNILYKKQYDYVLELSEKQGVETFDTIEKIRKHIELYSENDFFLANELLNNLDSCNFVYEKIYEEHSKNIYVSLLAKKLLGCELYYDIYSEEQYFDKTIINLGENEVFIDAGSYNGDTILEFIKHVADYNKIYAFEPNQKLFCELVNRMQDIPSSFYLNLGLYNKNGMLDFFERDLGNSHIRNELGDGNSVSENECLAISGDCLNLNPTFIKMDIEGAELEAVCGLSQTIKKYKPKLAISVYHKHYDLWKIPIEILNIDSNYELFFRHHSNGIAETVCYAVNQKIEEEIINGI